ncbi:MAG TPA: AsmA-like C-terminal region-containing protein, partial [Steroidobacteraceae bacterium]|nr:AsmA-like C-terminal region-containing protein [Steroidobacteraceae bacterium]
GVMSGLPEPFGKASAATSLPLHLEVQGRAAQAQLHLALGERLHGVGLLSRSGERWRIERGALRLGAGTPELPGAPVIALEGRVARLDLPAYLALWQQVAAAQRLPPVQARLSTPELIAGHAYGEAQVTATGTRAGAQVSVEAAQLHGVLHWPASPDAANPALVQLRGLDGSAEDAALVAQLPALLGPAVELRVDDFRWQGRSLGRLHAQLGSAGGGLQVRELSLRGAQQELRGSLECAPQARCAAHVSLSSSNLARTLADYGLRTDVDALRAQLQGNLEWPQGSSAPLATLSGDLHMQLEEGTTQAAATDTREPFALFLVPGLLQGLLAQADRTPGSARLRFGRVTADFSLHDGVARTANLHLDGADAEILVRARVNLLARDYDGEAFILRGEERLPSALRGLGPTPRMAALWLSLRQWFSGSTVEDTGRLRLRGAWNDPIVVAAQ